VVFSQIPRSVGYGLKSEQILGDAAIPIPIAKAEEQKQMTGLASNSRWVRSHSGSFNREMRSAHQLTGRHAASRRFAIFELLRDNYRRWRSYRMIIAEFRRHPGMAAELGISLDGTERIKGIAHDVAMGKSVRAAIF